MVHSTVFILDLITALNRAFSTEEETVTQFRERLNIPTFEPDYNRITTLPGDNRPIAPSASYRALTRWERYVEEIFTPKRFKWEAKFHSPPEEDIETKILNENWEPLHIFFPGDHETNWAYLGYFWYDETGLDRDFRYRPHDQKGKGFFRDPILSSLELNWEYSEETLQRWFIEQVYRARLLTPSNNNGYFFFFR